MSTVVDGMSEKVEAAVDLDRVREGIESQLSLEILMKHNELRLINQELAKCQAAI
jgi:ADA HAT complex component 1